MQKLTRPLLLSAFCAFFLSGCAVGPIYQRPAINEPENYRSAQAPAAQASLADLPWWQVFQDENLQSLISEALENNYDLRIAVSRMEQSRQVAAQARSQFYPSINYDGAVSDGKNTVLGQPSPNGITMDSGLLDLSVFWEIDLWGRIRHLNEAARAQYLASEEARRGVTISLVSSVAQAYLELLQLDLSLEIARRSTASFEATLKLFTTLLEGGAASKLETATAEAYLGSVAATVPELERQIVLKENQINLLLGRNPGPITRTAARLDQTSLPEIPAGLPSALLERRPDIRQAELNLQTANAQVGVAQANFFPRIGLTTLFGLVSPELSDFTDGDSTLRSVGGELTGPIFQGGRLDAELLQAKAIWEEARLAYEFTALNAFQEVSNALISRQKFAEVREHQARTVKAYEEAVQIALKRYVAGKASYYEVLQNQQQLFPAENALAQTKLNQLTVVVQLYKALGGGWQQQEETPAAPSATAPDGSAGLAIKKVAAVD
ncbi:MAG: efflux transporter outer membrane subunit [Thermodesulfobacteriota bacterium]